MIAFTLPGWKLSCDGESCLMGRNWPVTNLERKLRQKIKNKKKNSTIVV